MASVKAGPAWPGLSKLESVCTYSLFYETSVLPQDASKGPLVDTYIDAVVSASVVYCYSTN